MPIVAELNVNVDVALLPLVRERLVWLSDAVIPGVADIARVTVPVKLFRLVRVRVEEPDAGFTRIVSDVGLADAEKSETFTVIVAV